MKLRNYTASFVCFFRGNLTKGVVRNIQYGQRLTISDVVYCSPWEKTRNQWRNWFHVKSGSSVTFLLIFEGSIPVAWRHTCLVILWSFCINSWWFTRINLIIFWQINWHHLDCNWEGGGPPTHIVDFHFWGQSIKENGPNILMMDRNA